MAFALLPPNHGGGWCAGLHNGGMGAAMTIADGLDEQSLDDIWDALSERDLLLDAGEFECEVCGGLRGYDCPLACKRQDCPTASDLMP